MLHDSQEDRKEILNLDQGPGQEVFVQSLDLGLGVMLVLPDQDLVRWNHDQGTVLIIIHRIVIK